MMNRLFFFFVIFNFTNNLYSQSLSSNVLANSGDFVVNENSVSSTIGESLVFTNSQNNYFLYQGFQNTAIAVNEQLFFQNIDLPAGWSYWSTYLSPKDPEMSDLLSSISDDLVILKDQHGDVFWPYFGINGIQNHTYGYGYQVKMQQNSTLEVCGYKIENSSIQLYQNWNILAYLNDTPMPVEEALFPIYNELIIMKDELANVYWPFLGINTIGNMLPGQAYAIKLYSDSDFSYPINEEASRLNNGAKIKPKYYSSVLNTGVNMTIGIPKNILDEIAIYGDEIGVFDSNNLLVGSNVFTENNMAVTVWGNDFSNNYKDGMEEGETLSFKIWNKASQIENILFVKSWEEGNGIYNSNDISIVGEFHPTYRNFFDVKVFPNPVRNSLKISFNLPLDDRVNISIINSLGQSDILLDTDLAKGYYEYKFNLQNEAGCYLINVLTKDSNQIIPVSIINN